MLAFDRSTIAGPAACPSGLRLVVRLLVAPSFVLLRLFDLVALSDVEGIVSVGSYIAIEFLIERVKSN